MRPQIETHLTELLASTHFANAPKHSAFLRFIVESTLAGQSANIKESVIAHEVYNRTNYDPAIDSLIRVEASRLRKKLETYYSTTPSTIRIRLAKGSYIPTFEEAPTPPPIPKPFPWRTAVLGLTAAALLIATPLLSREYARLESRRLIDQARQTLPVPADYATAKRQERGPKGLGQIMAAVTLYEQSLQKYPNNPAALEGLANAYYRALDYEPRLHEKMAAAAQRLLTLHPKSAEPHFYLAYQAHFFHKNYRESERLFQRALEFNPNDAQLYRYYALSMMAQGQSARSLPLLEEGLRRLRDSATLALAYIGILMHTAQYAHAERAAAQLLARQSNVPAAHSRRGAALVRLNRLDEAEAAFHACLALSPGEPSCITNLVALYHQLRRPEKTPSLMEQINALPPNQRHLFLAVIEISRSNNEAALQELQRAARAGDNGLIYARFSPVFAALHKDQRFQALFQ